MTTLTVIDEWVPIEHLPHWDAKVTASNRKASRAGLGEPYHLTVVGERESTHHNPVGVKITVHEAHLLITGEQPSLPGWRFVASIAWEDAGAIVNTLPGYTGPMLPPPASQRCDHCNTVRNRKDTYLVEGPGGRVAQVGRDCLATYTGIPLGWVDVTSSQWDREGGIGGALICAYDTRSLLRLTITLVDALGYVAASSGLPHTTRSDVALMWHGARDKYGRERLAHVQDAISASPHRIEAQIDAEVEAILTWIGSETPDSNYIANVQTILAAQQVSERSLGYAVSAVSAHRRHLGYLAERKAKEEAPKADVPEGRIEITGVVTTTRVQDGDYGPTLKMRVASPQGWAVWGTVPSALADATYDETSNTWVPGVQVGDIITFTAKIQRSTDDPTFGFASRPTKASFVERTTAVAVGN